VVNAGTNQLTSDSLSSPTTKGDRTTYVYQAYSGTSTAALIKRIGVITDTSIVTYDSTFTRRPKQVRLAQVKDETGRPSIPSSSTPRTSSRDTMPFARLTASTSR